MSIVVAHVRKHVRTNIHTLIVFMDTIVLLRMRYNDVFFRQFYLFENMHRDLLSLAWYGTGINREMGVERQLCYFPKVRLS